VKEMLTHVDNLLRHLFISAVPSITSEDQVRFQPPDQEWRTVVSNLGARNALNVYLVEIRENRKLRSNERLREIDNGIVHEMPAPLRMDCYYLITAWSPVRVTTAVEPALDEHQLLYDVTAALMKPRSLVPREVYFPDDLPSDFPPLIADAELPISLLPVEGFPKYAEFWGTMGNVHPWKPAVYLVVTIPVELHKEISGPLVTTRITEYRQSALPESSETLVHIGGSVINATVTTEPPKPVRNAWVRLESDEPPTVGNPIKTTKTNELGRFSFAGMSPGLYRLRVRAPELAEKIVNNVRIPSPTGEYDVRFE
jgi:hypothetical protein